jgi:hypothetical protein
LDAWITRASDLKDFFCRSPNQKKNFEIYLLKMVKFSRVFLKKRQFFREDFTS